MMQTFDRKYHLGEWVPGQVFVFGSNCSGVHGAGSALYARRVCHAVLGVGEGPTGMAYALPTKDHNIHTLPLSAIAVNVDRFIDYAVAHPEVEFFVTAVGCGLAGYKNDQIAPMFMTAPKNCIFPAAWKEYLTPTGE